MIAIVAGALFLALTEGLGEAWGPRTGKALAADTRSARPDPCGLIVGPATAYCERNTTISVFGERRDVAGAAWRLVPAGAGAAALVVWRLRAAGQRRR